MTSPQRFWAGLGIVILYLGLASVLLWLSYYLSPPTNPDQWKEFGVRAGIALTAVGAFVGIIVALFTLNAQINATSALENKKGEILKAVEDHKKAILLDVEKRKNELQRDLEDHKKDILLDVDKQKNELLKQIEELKGSISRQNEFLNRTLDAKTQAYNELFRASAVCYSELQYLARGEFNKKRVRESERTLIMARGLEANLDDKDREIIGRIIQGVYNIIDLAWDVEGIDTERKPKYEKIWNENVNVKNLGTAIKELQDRSLFYNKSTKID
jgi:hypothetical protein